MSQVLASILASKRSEIAVLRARGRAPRVGSGPRGAEVAGILARASGEPLRLVTEIKLRSPSAGTLSTSMSVADRAVAYASAGASMISVLCDGPFFDGSFAHLGEARRALQAAGLATPLLAKEFVLDEVQLEEAAASGADAALLIARIVDARRLAELVPAARALGLEPLVEVVTERELATALDAGARMIGVNARDLDTLEMDPARAARVLGAIGEDRVALHLSGLKSAADVGAVAASRADAALLGEALMRVDDPTPLLRAMLAAARGG